MTRRAAATRGARAAAPPSRAGRGAAARPPIGRGSARPPIGRPRKFREAMGLVSLRLPAPMLAAIERIAEARGASVSDVIRELLGEALRERERA